MNIDNFITQTSENGVNKDRVELMNYSKDVFNLTEFDQQGIQAWNNYVSRCFSALAYDNTLYSNESYNLGEFMSEGTTNCPKKIGEACAVKWVIRNTNKQPTNITAEEAKATGIKLCFSQEYSCHRWGTNESKAALRVVQKRTKKNKCSALLCVKGFFKTPKFYEFVVTKDHAEHTPGDMRSDICTLPLAKKYLHELAQQLEQLSKSASQIRIDMLRAVDRYGRKSKRKGNYYDIWNLMNKINKKLYHFDKDQMTSFLIWMNNKLPALNFNIFKANTLYSPDPSAFAYGFMSPVQQEKIKTATSFCLDGTHAISSNVNEILYTLLVQDEDIGRGWPVAFMQKFTPFRQLSLQHPFNFASFTVKIPGSLISEARILRGVMMKSLQEIIYEEDIDEFHHKIVQFKEDFDDQESFLDYFERNWCTEAKFKIWSRAYHERQFSHMLTNNYIESWHNQLKTVFMKRSRNKRLDKLVFVLVHNVKYYLTQEYKRVMSNNGPMSSFTRQQRIHEMEAEEVDDDDKEMMIVASGTAEDVNWQVWSFVNENTAYVVQVAEPNLIILCTCFGYQQRYKPFSTSETATITPTISRTSAFIQQCIDINQTLRYSNQDLLTMQQYMTEDDGQTLFDAYQCSLQVFQSIKNKYEVHLRRSHTQE
ncbi:hypothetical protein PHYBLDRAFT_151513 [Phycomyces blakesleeanus NRRL 1555(-)]|uniref:MULE transposase domain-containing protein n=1 Tax=Phycomyces blakesleeanus (strain ATCC 8743b / DSM 1359 / FGSC 10004 / NBRC 33097 / NRRL 1555) TaxID=763407 RepID=A0A162ZJP2_PHYB8|nr:hypothetical protein PHYBLDRAFT_151513 [Phycomyces blakesleeanus NRRL 1555(-)]OAD67261.1 hypothetical protein PHYBLDRAFT_151513 [Phycomyces blakesleeanus NRRL 1555(-)]|eukprot:XP_018285301.1 hypothetical protein PHYBLDRAFT_151513 [Phycomyces blakesleeanus NRRL 1555(-)]